jgi:hypothetical protein
LTEHAELPATVVVNHATLGSARLRAEIFIAQ